MGRTEPFRRLQRAIRIATFCETRGLRTDDGIAEVRALEERARNFALTRRRLLGGMTALAGAGVLGSALRPNRALAAPTKSAPRLKVGVVGAGLAGLACADVLSKSGVEVTVHEAASRVGGRCYTIGGASGSSLFPGQVAEGGGELIDNLHKTMLGYAKRFRLGLEDLSKEPGEVVYHFNGQHYPESVVVDEFRNFVAAMQADLRTLSGAPSADSHNAGDIALDYTDLDTYLRTRGAGPVVSAAIIEAYEAEYGLEAGQQSSLNFLLFIHADKRSKFTPFGVFSDERYHVVGGNSQIARGLANELPDPVRLGEFLVDARKTASGAVQLTFQVGSGTMVETYDAVVLTVPFSVLRGVQLDPSLGLPAWKTHAIQQLGYGTNAKTMIGFRGPFWKALGCNGTVYSDLPNLQNTWETNPSRATAQYAILTDYASGPRGAALNPANASGEAARFVADLDRVLPGALQHVRRDAQNKIVAHLEHWPSNPLSKGSYTCYTPGQFVTLCGNEGKHVGNVYFAGEHANSFYVWQGFMEGAALSGIDAANAILQDAKVGALAQTAP